MFIVSAKAIRIYAARFFVHVLLKMETISAQIRHKLCSLCTLFLGYFGLIICICDLFNTL